MPKPIILVDASSYFFRAFHALPPLTTSKGRPTGAIYGVANMIKRLVKDYQPEHIAVVFDAAGKTFRDDWYPEYKAHRQPMPQELRDQFHPLLELLEAMGFPIVIVEGVEADDVIGTLALQASAQQQPVIISTGDKDLAQLVNEHVTLINTMTNQTLDIAGVQTKFGVLPEQIVDYLTLIGDSSDNIPGVDKCGPKTAVKWLTQYQSLDTLLTHMDEIGGKIGENLRASLTHLPLSKRLVTIKSDVPLSMQLDELRLKPANAEKLLSLVKEFEFKLWLKELLSTDASVETVEITQKEKTIVTQLVDDEQTLSALMNRLTQANRFSMRTKIMGHDPLALEIAGLGIAFSAMEAYYLPFETLDKKTALNALKPILENTMQQKIGHDLKQEYLAYQNDNIHLTGLAFDTMLESYVLNSTASRHDLDSLALKYLGRQLANAELTGKASKQLSLDTLLNQQIAPQIGEEAAAILELHDTLAPLLATSLHELLNKIEMPLLSVLAEIERHGVLLDCAALSQQGQKLHTRMKELEIEATTLAGHVFNLNSPKQLQEILFDELHLPVLSKTPTGQPSTAESVLQELAYEYRLPAVILEYRSLSKLVTTYIDALPKRISAHTERVHTSYNQAVAATGRLSSSEPNLQNIPIRSEEGRLIRTAFIAPPGYRIVAADYSQIELRIMAHLSQDAGLLHAFSEDLDIHTATASEIFQVPLSEVTGEQRRRAKATNFGLIYGMSAFGLAKQIGVDRQDAQHYIDQYFLRYPGVLDYMDKTRAQGRQQGFVETLFGRRLYLPEINARNLMRQRAAERTAINAPMQGTAADIIKRAMINLHAWQAQLPPGEVAMIMQVHDELIFEIREDKVAHYIPLIREHMENAAELTVPLRVSVGVGTNWDEAH